MTSVPTTIPSTIPSTIFDKLPKDLIGVIVKQAKPQIQLTILNEKPRIQFGYYGFYHYIIKVNLCYGILSIPFTLQIRCAKWCTNVTIELSVIDSDGEHNVTQWYYNGIRTTDSGITEFYFNTQTFEIGNMKIDIGDNINKREVIKFVKQLQFIIGNIVKEEMKKL